MIESPLNPVPEDIQQNLFKVLCAILNLRPGQRGAALIDDSLLNRYLDQISMSRSTTDNNIITQFQIIKNLINRKSYCLNDKQMKLIHMKYLNMYHHRRNAVFEQKRAVHESKYHHQQPNFQPSINTPQEAPLHQRSQSRG